MAIFLTSNCFTIVDEFLNICQFMIHLLLVTLIVLLFLLGIETDPLDSESETVRLATHVVVILNTDVDVADAELDTAEQTSHQSKERRLRKLGDFLFVLEPFRLPSLRVSIVFCKLRLELLSLLLSKLVPFGLTGLLRLNLLLLLRLFVLLL